MLTTRIVLIAALVAPVQAVAQADSTPAPKPKPWYERLSLRGYAHLRLNDLLRSNEELACAQCDRSIGGPVDFFFRRARFAVSGDLTRRIAIYIQTDLAQGSGEAEHFLQLRDLYADLWVDSARTLRFRVGQSKVPWGWENLQSSSRRLPFDRSDAINSGMPGERDLGVMVYWTPPAVRDLLEFLADSGLKGTGDYGMIGLGVFNGQSANRAEANDDKHVALRVAYPFRAGSQIVELGVHGYTGMFDQGAFDRTEGVGGGEEFVDRRVGVAAVLYPLPFGLSAEWTWGDGPEYDPATNSIRTRSLHGGYVQASYRTAVGGDPILPYARGQYYDGGKKHERDARSYTVRELEVGVEYTPVRALELTAAYVFADRRFEDGANPDNEQEGSYLRLQAQLNY